jgi:hypothetical protein
MESTEKLELLRRLLVGDGKSVAVEKRDPGDGRLAFSSSVRTLRRGCDPAGEDVAFLDGESTVVAIDNAVGGDC